jgi:hypothetical protein
MMVYVPRSKIIRGIVRIVRMMVIVCASGIALAVWNIEVGAAAGWSAGIVTAGGRAIRR